MNRPTLIAGGFVAALCVMPALRAWGWSRPWDVLSAVAEGCILGVALIFTISTASR